MVPGRSCWSHSLKHWGQKLDHGCHSRSFSLSTHIWLGGTSLLSGSSRRSIRYFSNATPRQTLSSSTSYSRSTADKSPLIRLYRILLKQCRLLAQKNEVVLLQQPLNPHEAGLSTVFTSSLDKDVTPQHVLCIFEAFRDHEILDAVDRAPEGMYPTTTADASYWTDEQRLLKSDWLAAHVSNTDINDDDDWTSSSNTLETLWTTPETIRQAIRLAFAHSPLTPALNTQQYTAWAIKAYQYLTAQTEMQRLIKWRQDPSGIRVTCLARCVGRSVATSTPNNNKYKYRFVYRVRMENVTTDQHFQLLGRSWSIHEEPALRPARKGVGSSESSSSSRSSDATRTDSLVYGDTTTSIKVHAPQTGAVGKHPVLQPGQVFEYMSGCDLATERGTMKGAFHFAVVPPGTPSASVGQSVAALSNDDNSMTDKRFEVPVKPFPLEPDQLPVRYDAY